MADLDYPDIYSCAYIFSKIIETKPFQHHVHHGMLRPFQELGRLTFSLFNRFIHETSRRIIPYEFRLQFGNLIPPFATSFGYYSMLQLHSYLIPILNQYTTLPIDNYHNYTATAAEFISTYEWLHWKQLQFKGFIKDAPIIDDSDLKTDLDSIINAASSDGLKSWTYCNFDVVKVFIDGQRLRKTRVNLKSKYDNPITYGSHLERSDLSILLRQKKLFLHQPGIDPINTVIIENTEYDFTLKNLTTTIHTIMKPRTLIRNSTIPPIHKDPPYEGIVSSSKLKDNDSTYVVPIFLKTP